MKELRKGKGKGKSTRASLGSVRALTDDALVQDLSKLGLVLDRASFREVAAPFRLG